MTCKPLPLHVTGRAVFRSCKRRYRYQILDRLAPISSLKEGSLAPMVFGSVGHHILSQFYSGMKSIQDGKTSITWTDFYNSFESSWMNLAIEFVQEKYRLDDIPEDDKALLRGLIEGYLKISQRDNWRILEVEKSYEVPINDKFTLKLTIDLLIMNEHGSVFIVDHKFKSRTTEDVHIEMDDQVTSYLAALRHLGVEVDGFIYNTIRKKLPTIPKELKSGGLSKDVRIDTTWDTYLSEIKRLRLRERDYFDMYEVLKDKHTTFFQRQPTNRNAAECATWFKNLAYEVKDIDRDYDAFYPNPGKDCSWCDFASICKLELEGADTSVLIGETYRIKEETER